MRLNLKLAAALALVAALPLCMAPSGSPPGAPPMIVCTTACNAAGIRVGGIAFVLAGTPTTRTSTQSVTADGNLQFNNVPAGSYRFTCTTWMWNTASTAVGYNLEMLVGGTLTGSNVFLLGDFNGTLGTTAAPRANTVIAQSTNSTANSGDILNFSVGFSTSTSGQVAFGWAQFASNATASNLGSNSWCQLVRAA